MNVLRELRKFKTKSALVKIRILILLAVMLTASTYAWFFSAKDSGVRGLRAKVTEWEVEYSIDDETITTEEITIAIDEFYPGMQDFEKKVMTLNKTATGADIKYEIKSVKLFGEEILPYLKTSGNFTFAGKTTNIFSTEEYPFNAGFSYDKDTLVGINPGSEEQSDDTKAELTIFANWSYTRSGDQKNAVENDALDTLYGEQAYAYYQDETLSEQYSPLEIVINITSAKEGHLPTE